MFYLFQTRSCFVIRTALWELRCWNYVVGTALLELRCGNCVVGTALWELRCGNFVVGTTLFLLRNWNRAKHIRVAFLAEIPHRDSS